MMNEELEQFENRLRRQSLRPIPAEWRAKIIAGAMSRVSKVESRGQKDFRLSTLVSRLSTVFWPHPKAWAGLAAIWIFIFILNFSMRDKTSVIAEKVSPPSPDVMVQLKLQQRMLAELIGANDLIDAERQKIFLPRPRSERVEILAA
ncbi:MAG TPA: hypothetical protein VHG89_12650 [Verrucomicrobiae bacterium]|nr:hypothetical protein [Verrucomicrobiae bacterium]